jgi:adenylate cyclase
MLLTGKRVFIVEDNAGNLAVMQTILKLEGATIFFERWGRDTYQRLLTAMPVDIILLDLMLPDGISGYDVFDTIRTFPALTAIPVVMVSAADPDLEMGKARQKGLQGYISKPIRAASFGRHIANAIGGKQVWAPTG